MTKYGPVLIFLDFTVDGYGAVSEGTAVVVCLRLRPQIRKAKTRGAYCVICEEQDKVGQPLYHTKLGVLDSPWLHRCSDQMCSYSLSLVGLVTGVRVVLVLLRLHEKGWFE